MAGLASEVANQEHVHVTATCAWSRTHENPWSMSGSSMREQISDEMMPIPISLIGSNDGEASVAAACCTSVRAVSVPTPEIIALAQITRPIAVCVPV